MRTIQYLLIISLFNFFAASLVSVVINYQGEIVTRYSYYAPQQTFLNPNEEIFNVSKSEYKVYTNFLFNLELLSSTKLTLKIRPQYFRNDYSDRKDFIIDDAYINFCFGSTNFVSLGKMNIIDSVGLSYFPTDFFVRVSEVDYSKKEEERKSDREGSYILMAEKLFKGFSLSLVYVPQIKNIQDEQSKFRTKISFAIPNVDFSFSYFYSSFSACGINISGLLTDKLELHSEIALLNNSERKYLNIKQNIAENINLYEAYDPPDSKKIFLKSLIGGHYTFPDKTNIIVEYFYNEDGYSDKEWTEFINIVKENYNNYLSPLLGIPKDIFKSNLGVCNSLMTYRYLRKNYLFLRFWRPDLIRVFEFIAGILINLDDKSFVFFPEVGYKMTDNIVFYLGGNIFSGDKNAEFGLVPYKNYFYTELRYFF